MKYFLPLVTLTISIFFSLNTVNAQEVIESFDSQIVVGQDSVLHVTETIVHNTGNIEKHGIIRNIKNIFTNMDGDNYKTPISVDSITGIDGSVHQYTQYQEGNTLALKIGDPNRTFSGLQTYIIRYSITGGIERFTDHDEIYYNVTGNSWTLPIKTVTARFMLPQNIPTQSIKTDCATGKEGSTEKNCLVTFNGSEILVTSTGVLNAGEGLTGGASFDTGYINVIPKEKVEESMFSKLAVFGYILWLFGPAIGILIYYFKKGRDPKTGITSIPALFEPPKDASRRVTPSEAGILEDERVDARDISATIVDLAIRGYLKITESDKKLILTKSDKYEEKGSTKLEDFESELIDILFANEVLEVDIKNLTDSQKMKILSYQNTLYKDMVKKNFFPHNPQTIRTIWFGIGMLLFFLGSFITGIMALVLAYFMPRKTFKGARTKVDVVGLRKFLTSQTEQLEFQEKNWYLFEKLLPYAVAFGVTKTWAGRFKDLHEIPRPDWYEGSNLTNLAFANTMANSFTSGFSSAMSPSRSSSGFSSGFSGGGFSSGGGSSGGGGGSSW